MRIGSVDAAIRKARMVVKEWDEVGLNYWREDHTRYWVIDPVIRALGAVYIQIWQQLDGWETPSKSNRKEGRGPPQLSKGFPDHPSQSSRNTRPILS